MSQKKNIRFFSSIKAFKAIDSTVQILLLLGVIHIVIYLTAESPIRADSISKALLIGFCILLGVRVNQFFKKDEAATVEVRFEDDIDQLVVKMVAACGLHLKDKIGDYYTFSSRNRIMPNVEYTVRDCGKYCIVISPQGQFHDIDSLLRLQSSQNEVGE